MVFCTQKGQEIQSNKKSLIKDKDCNDNFLKCKVFFFFARPVIPTRAVAGETASDIGGGFCDFITLIKG